MRSVTLDHHGLPYRLTGNLISSRTADHGTGKVTTKVYETDDGQIAIYTQQGSKGNLRFFSGKHDALCFLRPRAEYAASVVKQLEEPKQQKRRKRERTGLRAA